MSPPSPAAADWILLFVGQDILAREGHAGAIYQATGPAALDGATGASLLAKVTGKTLWLEGLRSDGERVRNLDPGPTPGRFRSAASRATWS